MLFNSCSLGSGLMQINYSSVPNRRAGRNKRAGQNRQAGGTFSGKSINVEDGFLFCGRLWTISKSVSVGSTFIREMRVVDLHQT